MKGKIKDLGWLLIVIFFLSGCGVLSGDPNKPPTYSNENQTFSQEHEQVNSKWEAVSWKEEITRRFQKQEPYFFPSIENFKYRSYLEFVYDNTSPGRFEYKIFSNEKEFRILSHDNHNKLQHSHTIHDEIFSFKKEQGSTPFIVIDQISEPYNIDTNVVKIVNEQSRIYDERLLEYTDQKFKVYWLHSLNSQTSYDKQINLIKNHINYLRTQNINNGTINIIELERTLIYRMYFSFDRTNYEISMSLISPSQFNEWLLGISKISSDK